MSNDEHENSEADSIPKRIEDLKEYLDQKGISSGMNEEYFGPYPNVIREILKCQNMMVRCCKATIYVLKHLVLEGDVTFEEMIPLLESIIELGEAERSRHERLCIYATKNPPKDPHIFGKLFDWIAEE
jgi:hypothetical protein